MGLWCKDPHKAKPYATRRNANKNENWLSNLERLLLSLSSHLGVRRGRVRENEHGPVRPPG